jgi:hypothetical protein
VRSAGHARIVAAAPVVVQPWNPNTSNVQTQAARVLWNNEPVVGARVLVGPYPVPQATGKNGSFTYDIDDTVADRDVIRVSSLAKATVNGRRLTAGQRKSIMRATGGFTSAYGISGLHARVRKNGSVLVTGRAADSAHNGPPGVHLLSYTLSGRVTDASGDPVKGAVVVTRTQDRQYWTRSNPTNANGYYSSFFPASDQTDANPVPISVGVALGNVSYGGTLGTNINFARLKSSVLNIQLGNGTSYNISTPEPYTSSIQSGLTVGVTVGDKVVKPVSAHWPKRNGDFSLVLPSSVRGHTVSFFQSQVQVPSRFPTSPGGAMDMKFYKGFIGPTVPRNLAPLAIPRH